MKTKTLFPALAAALIASATAAEVARVNEPSVNDLKPEARKKGDLQMFVEVAAGAEIPCTEDFPFGEKDFITLKPGEFRLMDAPVLDKDEMLNTL